MFIDAKLEFLDCLIRSLSMQFLIGDRLGIDRRKTMKH